MILQHKPPLHLTYCMNIHPGESWQENLAAIKEKATAVKARVAPQGWFGLGLRIGAHAAAKLLSDNDLINEAHDLFANEEMYPFSINGFPYGRFHNGPVKERVYEPDWRTPERRDYTMQLADILSRWLPPQIDGSISTLPCSFKPWITSESDRDLMARNLAAVCAYLSAIHDDTGQEIHLGLEPEPDCYLETTQETIAFFENALWRAGAAEVSRLMGCSKERGEEVIRTHLGVCFDTCHVAMQFEDPFLSLYAYANAGIRISKIQLSAALRGPCTPEVLDRLQSFAEPIYLHQTKARSANTRIAWYDLPDALEELPQFPDAEEVRVHFHVPLFMPDTDTLSSTASLLKDDFWHQMREGVCSHLEIETYTFDVLPEWLNPGDVVKSISREYAWVLGKLDMHP